MSNWKNYATNALESFNPLNDIEDKSSREEEKKRREKNVLEFLK